MGAAKRTAEQHFRLFEWVRVLDVEIQADYFDFMPLDFSMKFVGFLYKIIIFD